ncbi:MAG: glycosyltransferase [bacterium]|nr:glycosyltransferase [bacterium]
MEEILDEVIDLSIIVPFFNDEGTAIELYFRLNNVISRLNKAWEIIFVDNGSDDRTLLLLKELREKDEHIKIVRLIKNFGENAAIMAGFSQAKGKVVVTIAGDMTERPEDIPCLIETIDKGYDVASGYRVNTKQSIADKMDRISDWLIFKMTGMRIEGYACRLRAYRHSIINLLKQCRERTQSIPHLVCWLGAKTIEIELNTGDKDTETGLSLQRKKNPCAVMKNALSLASNLGVTPIRIVCLAGAWVGGLGILASMFFIASGLFVDYCGLNVGLGIVLIVLSMQLFGGALIGEYIAKIYTQIQGRPYYIIEEVIE